MLKNAILDNTYSSDLCSLFHQAVSDFEQRNRVFLTIHDLRGIFYDSAGRPFLPGRHTHRHPYCRDGRRGSSQHERLCLKDCALNAETFACKKREIFIHNCWKGVQELVVPIISKGQLQLLLYIGAFQAPAAPPEPYLESWGNLPRGNMEIYRCLAQDVLLLGHGILALIEEKRTGGEIPLGRKKIIREFIHCHAHENVTLSDLGKAMHVSASRASHLCKQILGVSFQDLLLKERMERAGNLLINSEQPMKFIASQVGFSNVFYFYRMFRKFYGMPPGQYRNKAIKDKLS